MNITIKEIPFDFYNQFKTDTDNAMRDIGGWCTTSITPLFDDLQKFNQCINYSVENPFNEQYITFSDKFQSQYQMNYYGHLDGSEGNDSYGICVCHAVGKNERGIIIQIDFLGAPSKRLYGENFNLSLIDDLFTILVQRRFKFKIVTYDRATDIRPIKNILEPEGTIVTHMSIDRTANYPIIDYNKSEPPFMTKKSTDGQYDQPFLDFQKLVNNENLIVPFYNGWVELPYTVEHNREKKLVTKLPGQQDNLIQAVAGALFNCINNEFLLAEMVNKPKAQEIDYRDKPDNFEQFIDTLKIGIYEKNPGQSDNFDMPDEIGIDEDDFNKKLNSRYFL